MRLVCALHELIVIVLSILFCVIIPYFNRVSQFPYFYLSYNKEFFFLFNSCSEAMLREISSSAFRWLAGRSGTRLPVSCSFQVCVI